MSDQITVHDAAMEYQTAGWNPLELPANEKGPPPEGRTGHEGVDMTLAEVMAAPWSGNVGIRMPADVIGLDFDIYRKGGAETLIAMQTELGKLPETFISHNGRNDGSGIRFYRVPPGLSWTQGRAGLDIIQRGHRYACVWPSIHPDGRRYGWWDQAEDDRLEGVPQVEDLPELPFKWMAELSRASSTSNTKAVDLPATRAFFNEHVREDRPGYKQEVVTHFERRVASSFSRHDTMQHCLILAMERSASGVVSARDVAAALADAWVRAVAPDQRRMEITAPNRVTEFEAMLRHAIGKVVAKPQAELQVIHDTEAGVTVNGNATAPLISVYQRTEHEGNGEGEGEESLLEQPVAPNLPEEFWLRPELANIREWAHSRMRSADAVYAAIRARYCTLVPYTVVVDTTIAVPISLNSLIAVIGTPGSGKSTSASLGQEVVTINRDDIYEGPLGSGEGVAEVFFTMQPNPLGKGKPVKTRTREAALLHLDEGEALSMLGGGRKASTLLPTLRSAYSGQMIGQSNATVETHRVIKAGSYRLVLLVGLQDTAAKDLLADESTGTPQRFVMFNANDPSIPASSSTVPLPVLPKPPAKIGVGTKMVLAPDVLTEVRDRALAVQRGLLVLNPLDAHRDQNRIKEAAMLALMAGRKAVSDEDWELAGLVMDTSDAVRSWIVERNLAAAAREEALRTATAVQRQVSAAVALDDTASARAAAGGAKAMARRAAKAGGPVTMRELSRAVAGKHRAEASIEDMLERALDMDWLKPGPDDGTWVTGGSAPT